MEVTHSVILAAGDGTRMAHRTVECPKPLLPLLGRPLVTYTLTALRAAGIRDVTMVVGYQHEIMRETLGDGSAFDLRIHYAINLQYLWGASLSLAAAREQCGDAPFLLLMSDHLHDAGVIQRLLEAPGDMTAVAAEFGHERRTRQFIDEATKLKVDGTAQVMAIGKQLDEWHALDAGAFLCTTDVWGALDAAPTGCELSPVFTELAGQRKLRAVDIGAARWHDVDTEADLIEAQRLLEQPAVEL